MHDSSMNNSDGNSNNNTGHSHSPVEKSKSMSDWEPAPGEIGSDFGYEPGYLFDSGLPASGYLFESIAYSRPEPSQGECLAM